MKSLINNKEIDVKENETIAEACDRASPYQPLVDMGCRSVSCGLCIVTVDNEKNCNEKSPKENELTESLSPSLRLACCLKIKGSIIITTA